ncbi:unnamed protein product, partial [Medioppia subpectinata]
PETTPKEVKVDRRKPQLKAKTEPTPEPKVVTSTARRGGRAAKRGRASPVAANASKANNVNSNSDGENSESQTEGESNRKRGRKPKEPIKEEDRYVPNTDSAKRGIMAEGSTSLRRRDQIKSKARYSPPPFDTPKRERTAIKFPSTTSSSTRYVNESDDEDMVSVSPTFKLTADVSPPRRKANTNRANSESVHTIENVGVSKIGDGSKLVVTLPDGTNIKVDASTTSTKKVAFKGTKKVGEKLESVDIECDDAGAKADPMDDDYKPSRGRKSTDGKTPGDKPKVIQTYSRVTPKQTISSPKLLAISQTQLKSQMSGQTSAAKITPKFVTTPSAQPKKTPVATTQRRTTTPMTKYIDGLPELHECTLDVENDSQLTKLPDKILLLHSELPLNLALSVEHEEESFLFRQIVSPMEPNRYVCLLCKGIDVSYATKEEKDIISHYRTLHELDVVTANAKFSEDIVFICLPKTILQQLKSNNNAIPLNAPCQYCGDEVRLINIENMKQHYCLEHNKEVTMIEQEEILRMHLFFYCSQCKHQSKDFESHHKHMKDEHKCKSYKCKNCVLITQDLTRLKTHFRAKHMINNSTQNMQCYYCHGLLIGIDRLNKHIQQSHMVQTGPTEFSCVACLKPCGRGKDLLTHAQSCAMAGHNNRDSKDKDEKSKQLMAKSEPVEGEAAICFLCGDEFENNEICLLHQHHVHMRWVSDLRRYTNTTVTAQLIDPPLVKELTIDDLTPEEDLRKSKVDTIVGHWCRMSFGVVLWELMNCEIPYRDVDSSAIIWGVGNSSLTLPVATKCFPEGFQLLMKQCWNAKARNRPSFKNIIMHIEIAANELVNIEPDEYFKLQIDWREEIQNCLLRMKRNGRRDLSTDDEAELIKKRKDELSHAQDIREHYERKLERANNLYMELTACMLQLEQKEKELIRREMMQMGGRGHSSKKQIVGPLLQAAHERISSSRRGSYRPDQPIETQSPNKQSAECVSCHGSARSRIKRNRQRRSINSQTGSGNHSHLANQTLSSTLNNNYITYSPRPSPLQERKSFVDTETQTDYVLSESDLVSPSSSTLSPMSAIGRVETVIEMGDNDMNNGIIRGIPKTSTTSTFDSGFDSQSCLSTPTARTSGHDRSPVTPISGKSSSVETDTEDSNKTKLKTRSTNITQNPIASLSSIDENGVNSNTAGAQLANQDVCDVAIVRRGSITCQRRFAGSPYIPDFNKMGHKSQPYIGQRPVLQHAGSNISIASHSSSSGSEEEGAVDSDDYGSHPSHHKRKGGLAQHLSQHRLSGQSISTLSSDGNLSDEEEGNTSEYSSNQNDMISSLSNPDLTNANVENQTLSASTSTSDSKKLPSTPHSLSSTNTTTTNSDTDEVSNVTVATSYLVVHKPNNPYNLNNNNNDNQTVTSQSQTSQQIPNISSETTVW